MRFLTCSPSSGDRDASLPKHAESSRPGQRPAPASWKRVLRIRMMYSFRVDREDRSGNESLR